MVVLGYFLFSSVLKARGEATSLINKVTWSSVEGFDDGDTLDDLHDCEYDIHCWKSIRLAGSSGAACGTTGLKIKENYKKKK